MNKPKNRVNEPIFPIILAGGSGTRLWPLSRKLYPKQFIQLAEFGGKSLFQKTLERAVKITGNTHSYRIVTNADYKFHCIAQGEELGIPVTEKNLVIEPEAKNTLAAIMLGVRSLENEGDLALIMPSDHAIENETAFVTAIETVTEGAKNSLVTFWIRPDHPNTGYGYIRSVGPCETASSKVAEFKEKPDFGTAEKYVNEWYLWNAGIFFFSKGVFLSELEKADPEYVATFTKYDAVQEAFAHLPNLSIDYGLLEKTENVRVLSIDVSWTDLGSFDALEEYSGKIDQRENERVPGMKTLTAEPLQIPLTESLQISATGNYAHSDTAWKIVVFIGCEDLLAIDTKDALLIAQKGFSQKVQEAVKILKWRLPHLTESHLTVYRPWGNYTIIDEGAGFKSKRLSVLPGKKLSAQMHYHRSEHWVVVSGVAKVTVGKEERILEKGESTFIPAGTTHRLENPGKVIAHLIESQIGDYLGEDDIVRFDDEYGRT
jgi:mannose-1-phosphate guanylyltransferase/mannose-6-phosphate isomerase